MHWCRDDPSLYRKSVHSAGDDGGDELLYDPDRERRFLRTKLETACGGQSAFISLAGEDSGLFAAFDTGANQCQSVSAAKTSSKGKKQPSDAQCHQGKYGLYAGGNLLWGCGRSSPFG